MPPAPTALRRVTQGLDVPPLAPLTTDHVLARSFYLLQRVSRAATSATRSGCSATRTASNDSVSPVIIGNNDWAAAWATDRAGRNLYAVVPGGDRQRTAGLPLRRQPRDVRAHRQLQGRPGPRAGDPGAAGTMKLHEVIAAVRFDPTVPLVADRSAAGLVPDPGRPRPVAAGARGVAAGRGVRGAGRSGSPGRGWCRRRGRACPTSRCWSIDDTASMHIGDRVALRDRARAAIEAAGGEAARSPVAHDHGAGGGPGRHPPVHRDRPGARRHPQQAAGGRGRDHRRAGPRHPRQAADRRRCTC